MLTTEREMRKHAALFIAVSEEVVKQSYEAPSWERDFLLFLTRAFFFFFFTTAFDRKFIPLFYTSITNMGYIGYGCDPIVSRNTRNTF